MPNFLEILLNEKAIIEILRESEEKYYLTQLSNKPLDSSHISERVRLCHLIIANIFQDENNQQYNTALVEKAYTLLKTININNLVHANIVNDVIGIENIHIDNLYFFYLSSLALKSDKLINIRIDLKDFNPGNKYVDNEDWGTRVINQVLEAFILLVRKDNGFDDIRRALMIIDNLQRDQADFEEKYLNIIDANAEVVTAYRLLALYHISKTISETAKYLIEGYSYKEKLDSIIRQHIDTATKLLENQPRIQSLAYIFEINLKSIYTNSIWFRTSFNDKVKKLCELKSRNGFIELLPSQRTALNRNLLDVASNVTVVQMPTSAGKTLLAEFNILVTKALRQDSKIIYIVPSRALVNQIYFDIRSDLEPLQLNIEKTSSAIELDPTENQFLQSNIDVLVTTPEKLDLLIKRNHPSVNDVSLFIIDEAHTIQNGQRGAKLELLLTMIKRERASAKFMLLSPFIGKTAEVVKNWLGGGNVIKIDWRPSDKIIFGIDRGSSKKREIFKLYLLKTAFNPLISEETFTVFNEIELNSSGKKNRILEFSAKQFYAEGKTMLILCVGKKTADTRAEFIYDNIANAPYDEEIELVRKFIIDEVGRETLLTKVLSKRIAVHHAGLSDDTKLLIEHLIRTKKISYICSTTTIAEGVNFPVSTVFFDSLKKGDADLNSKDFWNIAGRAGRTLVDNFGKIILPFHSNDAKENAKSLINESTEEIVSVLSELFINADVISARLERVNSSLLTLINSYYNSVGPLVQYFVHLISMGEDKNYSSHIEDLFKDSLEYYSLSSAEERSKFIKVCKDIFLKLQEKYSNQKGLLAFSDKTGFSIPSVLEVMRQKSSNEVVADINGWTPEKMFDESNIENLTEKIKVIADLKETQIGTESEAAKFNPELIAQILISWVKGEKLFDISSKHPYFESMNDTNDRINEFIRKINDVRFKASWGLSALEGIVKGKDDNIEIKDSYIPSLIYYGVDNEQSLVLRMIGVPRSLSFSMSKLIDKPISDYSFPVLRKMVKDLSTADWNTVIPKNSNLSGTEWKLISQILVS